MGKACNDNNKQGRDIKKYANFLLKLDSWLTIIKIENEDQKKEVKSPMCNKIFYWPYSVWECINEGWNGSFYDWNVVKAEEDERIFCFAFQMWSDTEGYLRLITVGHKNKHQ